MQMPPRRPNLGPARHPSPHTLISGPGLPPYGDRASPAKGAPHNLDFSGPRGSFSLESRTGPKTPSRPRPPRSDSSPLPAPQRASGPGHKNILPEGQGGTRTPPFYTRCRTLHNTLKLFPLLSLLVQSTDSCVKHSSHCHAASASLLKFCSPAFLLPEGTT